MAAEPVTLIFTKDNSDLTQTFVLSADNAYTLPVGRQKGPGIFAMRTLSRNHGIISYRDGKLYYTEGDSRHGTRILLNKLESEETITPSRDQRYELGPVAADELTKICIIHFAPKFSSVNSLRVSVEGKLGAPAASASGLSTAAPAGDVSMADTTFRYSEDTSSAPEKKNEDQEDEDDDEEEEDEEVKEEDDADGEEAAEQIDLTNSDDKAEDDDEEDDQKDSEIPSTATDSLGPTQGSTQPEADASPESSAIPAEETTTATKIRTLLFPLDPSIHTNILPTGSWNIFSSLASRKRKRDEVEAEEAEEEAASAAPAAATEEDPDAKEKPAEAVKEEEEDAAATAAAPAEDEDEEKPEDEERPAKRARVFDYMLKLGMGAAIGSVSTFALLVATAPQ